MGKYAAPELFKPGSSYAGEPIDIWSAGVILFAMLAGRFPFDAVTPGSDALTQLRDGTLYFPQEIPVEVQHLLLLMWNPDPEARATLAEVSISVRVILIMIACRSNNTDGLIQYVS